MVDGISGSSAASAASTTAASTKKDNAANKDLFLKLLVAQMKNQDPSNPTDTTQQMTQMAQFTMVEKLEAMETASNNQAATALVGKTISYNTGSDAATGTVDSLKFTDSGPVLVVGGKEVPLASIKGVVNTPATATPTTSTPATGTTPTT